MQHSRARGMALVFLGGILAVSAAVATPSYAAGESTTAILLSPATNGSGNTFVWSYAFDQNGGHGLSNVAIRFCDDAILSDVVSAGPGGTIVDAGDVPGGHRGFGPGIKFATTATTGTLTVVFGDEYDVTPDAMSIQSHSGDGVEGDAITVAAGPGPCPADTTTTASSSTTTTTIVNNDDNDDNGDNAEARCSSALAAPPCDTEGEGDETEVLGQTVTANPGQTGGTDTGTGGTETGTGGSGGSGGPGDSGDTGVTNATTPGSDVIGTQLNNDPAPGTAPETTVVGVMIPPTGEAAPSALARTGPEHVPSFTLFGFALAFVGLGLRLMVRDERRTA